MRDGQQTVAAGAGLLDPAFLRRLEQAAIASRHILKGRTKGERRSPRKGSSVEFADFRSYAPGDDLRYLDWNAYARLQKLFLKLFIEEEDLHLYLLLDCSASMSFGAPSKLEWGAKVAAALAYVGLSGNDRVQLFAHSAGNGRRSRAFRGRGAAPEAFDWLASLEAGGGTDVAKACDFLTSSAPGPGVVVLISDLLSPAWEPALARLAAARGDACVLHILAPEDCRPDLEGDLRLVDSETGDAREVTVGTGLMRRYERALWAFTLGVRQTCFRYGFSYLLVTSDDPVEDVVLRQLRRLQVVR